MKRVILGSIVAMLLATIAFTAGAVAQTTPPSLGDYARSVRQQKPRETKAAANVIDNDNLPSASISVVGKAPETPADAAKNDKDSNQADAKSNEKPATSDSKADDKVAEKKAPTEMKPGQPLEERQKVIDAWKKRIADQKAKVDELAHDLNDFQHNSTMAQVSLWPNTQKYGQQLADKQKALDQAKTDLSNLQEQARKAGVPASAAE
jgi:hypothetical protein